MCAVGAGGGGRGHVESVAEVQSERSPVRAGGAFRVRMLTCLRRAGAGRPAPNTALRDSQREAEAGRHALRRGCRCRRCRTACGSRYPASLLRQACVGYGSPVMRRGAARSAQGQVHASGHAGVATVGRL
ncbi:hypothetical protein BSLA_02r2907 [Burkholderia stabilis]|nr:hypothetical protein BSLA_02r2907 [Burkholderia stabilis]